MGRRTLTLGYAVTIADTLLAPFTPSNTARSGGTVYPVIRNLPALYDSKPNDPSSAPHRLLHHVGGDRRDLRDELDVPHRPRAQPAGDRAGQQDRQGRASRWTQWFTAFAPVGILLLALIPLLTYWIYPPEVKQGDEVPRWAGEELKKMGGFTTRETMLGVLVRGRAGPVDLRRQLHQRNAPPRWW